MATTINNSGVTFPNASVQPTATGTRQYLTTLTASSSASLNYTGFSNTYNNYDVIFSNILVTSGYYTCYRYYVSSAYQTASYYTAAVIWSNANGSAFQGGQTAYSVIDSSTYNVAGGGFSGLLQFYNCRNASVYKTSSFIATGFYYTAGYAARTYGSAMWVGGTAVVDGFQLLPTGGSIISGSIDIYGWN